MKGLCLDVPKALKTIISCEALHQECGTLHKIPSFGYLQQLQPQSLVGYTSAVYAFTRYVECMTQSNTIQSGRLLKGEANEKLLEFSKGNGQSMIHDHMTLKPFCIHCVQLCDAPAVLKHSGKSHSCQICKPPKPDPQSAAQSEIRRALNGVCYLLIGNVFPGYCQNLVPSL